MNQINWARDDGDEREIVSFGPGTIPLTSGTIRATAIVFQDPASRLLQVDLDQIAPSDATILLVGETGTGKELVSRYIHGKSLRQAKPFVAVNCGALSDTLAEADLFGHEKGAFTGALKTQAGWFEAANGGTLLLDEIGDLPLHLQVKLLRVLQEREVVRVGSRRPIPVDVRLIAATNVDLEAAVQAKRFREDLFFRLNVASVRLPPLRERPGDIEPLARHFLDVYKAKLGRADLSLGPDALRRLIQHPWPGNIRELENTIHNAALLARTSVIGAGDIRLRPQMRQPDAEIPTLEGETRALLEKAIVTGEADIFDRTVRTIIRTAYDLAGGNQVRAAETLGMSRNAFRTQLAHLGAIPARRRPPSDLAAKATPPAPAPTFRRSSRLTDLHIGFQKYGTSSILKARGAVQRRLAAKGFNITWTEFLSGPHLMDALGDMQVEFVATGEAPPIFAQAAGVPLAYVGYDPPAPDGEALVVHHNSPIRTVADLRGRRVAFHQGSNVHYFMVRALQAHGLSLADIHTVHMRPLEAQAALLAGQIDAWAIWDPLLSSAQIRSDVRVLTDGNGLVSNHQFYLTSQVFADRNPDVVAILLEELREVGEYAVRHSAEVAKFMTREIGIEVPALELAFSRLSYGAKPLDDRAVRQQQDIANTFHALGVLPSAVHVRDAVWSRA